MAIALYACSGGGGATPGDTSSTDVPVEVPCEEGKITFTQADSATFEFYEVCVAADGVAEAELLAIAPELTCGHAGAFAKCRSKVERSCQGAIGFEALGDEGWATVCELSALEDVRVISGGDSALNPYNIVLTLADGSVLEAGRDLTVERETKFSYGSAHIGTAVAFAVTDTITWPQSMTITLDFGKVVGMPPDFPIQSDGVGEYVFSDQPPAIEVYVELIEYNSLFAEAEGHVTLTQWGQNTGDIIAGHYSGQLIQDTALEDKLWVDVVGSFHFVLPVKHAGQPN